MPYGYTYLSTLYLLPTLFKGTYIHIHVYIIYISAHIQIHIYIYVQIVHVHVIFIYNLRYTELPELVPGTFNPTSNIGIQFGNTVQLPPRTPNRICSTK